MRIILFIVLAIFWPHSAYAAPFAGEVGFFDPGGANIFSPPHPIAGDLDIGAGTMVVDPFEFLGSLWFTSSVELLDEGMHTRPDGLGGSIDVTVEAGQLGAYMVYDWSVNTIPGFMVWDVATTSTGGVYTAADSDGDGIPGDAFKGAPAFTGFTIAYDFIVGDPPPDVAVTISVEGGAVQECSAVGGSPVSLTAELEFVGGAQPVMVDWYLDGESIGSGESVAPFVALGVHSVEVQVSTVSGESDSDSVSIEVRDTTPPDLDVAFVNRAGERVTETSGRYRAWASIVPTDICDPDPVAEGAAVPVFAVDDGDVIRIRGGRVSDVRLPVTALELSATARDASGNSASGMAVLSISGVSADVDD